MSTPNNKPRHTHLPEVPSLQPKKPPFTSKGRQIGVMLMICGIITVAALISFFFRHFRFDFSMEWGLHSVLSLLTMLSVYGLPIISPLALLSLSLYQKRAAAPVDALLLIFPMGCAIGCLLMYNTPADNLDGEVMGLALLTVLWGIISIPFCCISFFTKEKR